MLEVYDENGNKVLDASSSMTRIIHVYQKGKNNPEPPADKVGGANLFIISNVFIDIDKDGYNNQYFDHEQYVTQPYLYCDLAVWGVYA